MTDVSTKVMTPAMMISYPWFAEAQEGQTDPKTGRKGKDSFSGAFIAAPSLLAKYPKFGTSYDGLRAAATAAGESKFGGKWAGMLANPNVKSGFRTDTKPGYPEDLLFFVNAKSDRRPGLVYLYPADDGKPALVPVEKIKDVFYPGAIVRATFNAYGFDNTGNRGVGWGLLNVQLIDGKSARLDNRVAADEEFQADATSTPASLLDMGAE